MFEMFENFSKQNEEAYKQKGQQSMHGMDSKVFVISAGGSVFFDSPPNAELIAKLANSVDRLSGEGYKIVLVAGGGKTARNYVEAAEQFNANKFELDKIGIAATRLNAQLLINALQNPGNEVLTKVEDAAKVLDEGKVPVFGGLIPSFTTDAVAALIAEYLDATFINLTNVEGIYSSDPRKNTGAELLQEISYEKLVEMIVKKGSKPGQNIVLDLPCCLILQRSNLNGLVLNGNNIENFERAVRGKQFNGTVISGSEDADISGPVGEIETEIIPGKIKPARKKRKFSKPSSRKTGKKIPQKTKRDEFDPHDVYRIDFGR